MVASPFIASAGFLQGVPPAGPGAQKLYEQRMAQQGNFSTGSINLARAMSLVALEDADVGGGAGQMIMTQDLLTQDAIPPAAHQPASETYLQRDLRGMRVPKRLALELSSQASQELLW